MHVQVHKLMHAHTNTNAYHNAYNYALNHTHTHTHSYQHSKAMLYLSRIRLEQVVNFPVIQLYVTISCILL